MEVARTLGHRIQAIVTIMVRLNAGFPNLNGVFSKEQRRHVHGIFIV
jgi:hypothetical protein